MSDSPEKSKFDKKSGQRNSPELPPSEGDFWDLEDESESAPSITPEPRVVSQPSSDSQRVINPAPAPAPREPREPAGPKQDPKPEEVAPSPTHQEVQTQERPAAAAPENTKRASSSSTESVSKTEKLAILTVGVCLLLGAIWALSLFFSSIHTDSPNEEVDYPVSGEFATLAGASSYWREPNPESDRGVRQAAKLIPAAKLTLASTSSSGALRILFQDDSGGIVGDPITLTVTNGSFPDGSTETEVYATEGFTDEGDHAAYLTEQIDTWFIIVKEGPDRNASGRDFKDLCRIPISNSRH